ncbi:ribose-5-phosphate isomerase [Thalassobacillus devorans]|uniref:Ribose 5-phosphate isomerase A n=1 Tax=Thalassobacillus devorans TaxID=279813 RepID=A0ABQ1PGV8_9BACI|nr:ribose 5-phosphate isomerase A [Thalassobacillus devorans]NIK29482.1 ribose 5-phosphate isomerase A [Thalassobacillus devorans]GGC97029.1 ribose-5-phosphate isomerase [Thalassobacillus devorans]
MEWKNQLAGNLKWSADISNRQQKEIVAEQVATHIKDGQVIGVGSGSTSFLAIQAIADKVKKENLSITAIPTSIEVALSCARLGIPTTTLTEARPDWGFDGADEVDSEFNLIKGRGGAMFAEKLVMASSPKTFILVDESKFVDRLGHNFPVPVEVDPRAINLVETKLQEMDVTAVGLRMAKHKDGPVITEAGNIILEVRFNHIGLTTEDDLNAIPGVIENGIFFNYPVEVLSN